MKIRKISLQNIHSIRNETHIDLEKSPLAGCGLFVITGDTGAGKTTILDAMTLALYGQVCRSSKEPDIISHGAAAGYAACEFEAKGEIYFARWETSLRTNNAGEITPVKRRQLAKWNEDSQQFELLASGLTDVNNQIIKISSLDFVQFTRSVLLAQGDFAAFLNSRAEGRGALLEKITGKEIYALLSKAANQRFGQEKRLLNDLYLRRESIALLPDEELESLAIQLQQSDQARQKLQEELESLRRQKSLLTRKEELERSISRLEADAQVLSNDKQAALPYLERLALHKKASKFAAHLERLEEESEKATRGAEETDLIAMKLANLTIAESEKNQAYQAALQKVQAAKSTQIETLQLLDRVVALDERIKSQQVNLEERQRQYNQLENDQAKATAQLNSLRQLILSIESQLKETNAWLAANPRLASLPSDLNNMVGLRERLREQWRRMQHVLKDISNLQTEIEAGSASLQQLAIQKKQDEEQLLRLQAQIRQLAPGFDIQDTGSLISQLNREIEKSKERLYTFGQFKVHHNAFEELSRKLSDSQLALEQLSAEASELQRRMADNEAVLRGLKEDYAYRQEIYKQQQLLANYEKDRAQLKAGDPCPLCQSTHHPFRDHGISIYADKAREEFEQAEKELQSAQKVADELRAMELKNRIKKEQTAGRDDSLILGLKSQIEGHRLNMGDLFPGLAASDFSEDTISELKINMSREETFLPDRIKQREAVELAVRQLGICKESLRGLETQEGNLDASLQKSRHRLQELEKTGQEENESYQSLVSDLDVLLDPYGYRFEVDSAKATFDFLDAKAKEYQAALERKNELKNKLDIQQAMLKQVSQTDSDLADRVRKAGVALQTEREQLESLQLKRKGIFQDKDPAAERDRFLQALGQLESEENKLRNNHLETRDLLTATGQQLKEKQEQLANVIQSRDKLQKSLEQELQQTEFGQIENLRKSLIRQQEELQRLEHTFSQLKKREDAIESQLKVNREKLAEIAPQVSEGESLEMTDQSIEQSESEKQRLNEKIGAIRQQLSQIESSRQGAEELLQQIEVQQKAFNLWSSMNDLIGHSEGTKFRVFAQSLTLRQLVQLANLHLENLNGRYIIQKQTGQDLELEIVDTFQGNSRRSMGSLSGGEKFLVSLALAMGLSDLAGRQSSIGTLFIDEGFGTLDDEALDMAISTMENLHARGKTIGLISHVKALKERIITQVRVIKQGAGISVVEIPEV
ncbi:MAG: hypothetical protein RI973_34 [Bacteroidota bacterium]|jgi:exonuclease SbcC